MNRAQRGLVLVCKVRHDRQPADDLGCLRVHFGDVPETERRKVREQLERYCGQDAEGMTWIVDALRKLSGPS